ncbi:MAG: efflux transporter periplasmic adaptor subunit [Robiginitomaculum sp.]|nr:MAG: efflux transporter periplasmic adaptor subunit [Robiginitomaculum sp.]
MSFLNNGRAMPKYLKLVSALLITSALISGCAPKEEVETVTAIRPAKLIEIATSSNVTTMNLPAIIEASETSNLTFQVGGQLTQLLVVSGERVNRGTIIGRLDQRNYLNQVSEAKTAYDSADTEFKRAERLIAASAISRSAFEQRKSQLDVARAQLDSANKSLEDTVLRSPFAGIISAVHAKKFQNVQALEDIVTLQTTGAAEALVQLPATLIARSGRINSIETVIMLDAAPDVRIPATFKSIATQADASSQTFATKYSFLPSSDVVILPGMTGTLQTKFTRSNEDGSVDQINVPLLAILSDGDARYVWIVNTDSLTVSRRTITVGTSIGEMLEVTSGLQAGDTIVGAGASYLHEGMKIRRYEGK